MIHLSGETGDFGGFDGGKAKANCPPGLDPHEVGNMASEHDAEKACLAHRNPEGRGAEQWQP